MTESIFENRFKYADELARMGANIKVEGNSAIIDGVKKLTGARVSAPDLRAGAALVIAGLAAEGVTVVDDIVYIQRGYENFEEKLRSLGAEIEKVSSEKEIQQIPPSRGIINLITFYSEWWRYKGSVKPRQPLRRGRCQPERAIEQ